MSVRIAIFFPSLMSPIATPAQGALRGTPASIMARAPPQTLAIEEDPFDSRISETIRKVYGKESKSGRSGCSARSAKAP
jgi:hypothetical protein